MKIEPDKTVVVFFVICFSFGIIFGCVGFGVGLLALTAAQGVGLGILSFGVGAMFSAVFGAKRIMRALIDTIKEMELKNNE